MPSNKNASLRYRIINDLLKGGKKFKFDEFIRLVGEKLDESVPERERRGVSKRTLEYDIKQMRKDRPDGFGAEFKRENGFIAYSDRAFDIFGADLTEQEMMDLADLFSIYEGFWKFPKTEKVRNFIDTYGSKSMKHSRYAGIVDFELVRNSQGIQRLNEFIQIVSSQKQIILSYQPFNSDVREYNVHPLLLKEFNNRWYLIVYEELNNRFFNFALDRILGLPRKLPAQVNPSHRQIVVNRYKHVFGVSIPSLDEEVPTKIILQVSNTFINYIETKPIHSSQRIIVKDKSSSLVELFLYINVELKAEIRRMGVNAIVLEPENLRSEIANEVLQLAESYRSN